MTLRNLLIIVAMALAVYLPKVLPLIFVGDRITPGLRRWLQYVAPAVLSALVAPAILAPDGRLVGPSWDLAPYAATLLVALTTRRMFLAVAAGVAAVVVLTLIRT